LFPELTLLDVGRANLPILVGLIDPRQEALPLFLFREMEEYLDRDRAVDVQVAFEINDRPTAVVPERQGRSTLFFCDGR
jgi:hypothetical protein